MWMFFGLSFLLAAYFFIDERYKQAWKGKPVEANGTSAEYRERRYRLRSRSYDIADLYHRIDIGITGVSALDITLKQERWWDRLCRWLGVIVECQTGTVAFDSRFHVLSDSPAACRLLSKHPELLALIKRVPQVCQRRAVVFQALFIRKNRIWVQFSPEGASSTSPNVRVLFDELIPLLDEIRSTLEELMASVRPDELRDTSALRAALFLGTSSALMVSGLIAIGTSFFLHEKALDAGILGSMAWKAAGATIAVLLTLAFIMLWRSSRLHLVALELLLVGLPGAALLYTAALTHANISLDQGVTEWHELKVIDKRVNRHRGRTTSYALVLEPWEGRNHWTIRVDREIYERFKPGREEWHALHEVAQGRLGVRWLKTQTLAP